MSFTSSCRGLWLGVALWILAAASARADTVLAARVFVLPGVRLQDVQARVSAADAGALQLQVHAGQADIPALGWRHLGLNMQGLLRRDAGMRWLFDGRVQLAGAPGAALSDATLNLVVDEAANNLQVDLGQGKAQASAALPLDQPSHAQITLRHVPLGWLQGMLATAWSGRAKSGQLDAELAVDVLAAGVQTSGQFNLDDLGFDTPGGTLAGQSLSGGGLLGIDTTGAAPRIELDASLHGGELLLGPLYARLPDHPVQLALSAATHSGALELSRLHVGDADALQLDGSLGFDAKGALQKLKLDHVEARFPAAYQRYGQGWLATLGLRDMRTAGQFTGSLDMQPTGLRSFSFHTDGLDFADGGGRLAMDQLRGGLDWAAQGERQPSTLGWRSLRFYRIDNGAAQGRWQSRDGQLSLLQPLEIPLLGGRLRVGTLDWRPAAASGKRLTTSLVFTGVDMAAFSRALGWPAFPGTLGGAIPALRWVGDRIELLGGLSIHVFDGFVDVTQLSLQQPFGNSPVLTGDIHLRQLDLAAITSVFDFGNITGRLDGAVEQLRLVDWSPVAFKASLLADGGGRISQRAVNNLTTVGGGGVAGGLQGTVLKLFKTFGYKRIGLNCTLHGDVCQMGGLESEGDGYTIVAGSGLPHLQVVGHQSRVDWPTLVRRLKAATAGAAPEIR